MTLYSDHSIFFGATVLSTLAARVTPRVAVCMSPVVVHAACQRATGIEGRYTGGAKIEEQSLQSCTPEAYSIKKGVQEPQGVPMRHLDVPMECMYTHLTQVTQNRTRLLKTDSGKMRQQLKTVRRIEFNNIARFSRVIGAHLILSLRSLLEVGREEDEKEEEECRESRGEELKREEKGGVREERKRRERR